MACEPGKRNAKGEPPYADHRPHSTFGAALARVHELDPDLKLGLYVWRRR